MVVHAVELRSVCSTLTPCCSILLSQEPVSPEAAPQPCTAFKHTGNDPLGAQSGLSLNLNQTSQWQCEVSGEGLCGLGRQGKEKETEREGTSAQAYQDTENRYQKKTLW